MKKKKNENNLLNSKISDLENQLKIKNQDNYLLKKQ